VPTELSLPFHEFTGHVLAGRALRGLHWLEYRTRELGTSLYHWDMAFLWGSGYGSARGT